MKCLFDLVLTALGLLVLAVPLLLLVRKLRRELAGGRLPVILAAAKAAVIAGAAIQPRPWLRTQALLQRPHGLPRAFGPRNDGKRASRVLMNNLG